MFTGFLSWASNRPSVLPPVLKRVPLVHAKFVYSTKPMPSDWVDSDPTDVLSTTITSRDQDRTTTGFMSQPSVQMHQTSFGSHPFLVLTFLLVNWACRRFRNRWEDTTLTRCRDIGRDEECSHAICGVHATPRNCDLHTTLRQRFLENDEIRFRQPHPFSLILSWRGRYRFGASFITRTSIRSSTKKNRVGSRPDTTIPGPWLAARAS